MRRFILMLFAGTLICSLTTTTPTMAAPRAKTLKIYNWSDYLDESLLGEFVVWYKEQTGEDIHIVHQTYDLNEVALAKIDRAKADYDVVCPSDYIVERMLKQDLLLPINKDFGNTPNYIDEISPYINERFDIISTPDKEAGDYATPYMWATTGLLYNTRSVTREEAQTWGILWDTKYKNRIFMKDDSRQIYGIVRSYLNQDLVEAGIPLSDIANDCSAEAIAQVESELILARKNIAGFEMEFGKEMMTKEKADISVQYTGDAFWSINEAATMGVELDYVIPAEGSVLCIDAWVIPKYSQNPKAASYFINFMCRPDNAARNMDYIGYISAVAAPEIMELVIDESLDTTYDLNYFFGEGAEEVRCSPIRFSTFEEVDRCVIMRDFGDNIESVLVMWASIKGDNLSLEMVLIIIITIVLMAGFQIRKYYTQRKRRSYQQR